MNKIFKVIWSHVTQGWVVTSELSKSKGKASAEKTESESGLGTVLAGAVIVAGTLLSVSSVAVTGAQKDFGGQADKYCFYSMAVESVICGDATTSVVDPGGAGTAANPTRISRSVALGQGATVGNAFYREDATKTESYTDSVAIGTKAIVNSYQSVAIGAAAQADKQLAVAIGQKSFVNGSRSVAIGTDHRLYYSNL